MWCCGKLPTQVRGERESGGFRSGVCKYKDENHK